MSYYGVDATEYKTERKQTYLGLQDGWDETAKTHVSGERSQTEPCGFFLASNNHRLLGITMETSSS